MKRSIFIFVALATLWITPVLADNDFDVFYPTDQTVSVLPPYSITAYTMSGRTAGSWVIVIDGTYSDCLVGVQGQVDGSCHIGGTGSMFPQATSTPFYWNGNYFVGVFNPLLTQIVSVSPPDKSTTTPTVSGTVSAEVYIAPADIGKGYVFQQKWILMSDLQAVVPDASILFTSYQKTQLSGGTNQFASTTVNFLRTGRYRLITSILRPSVWSNVVGFLFGNDSFGVDTVVSTTTEFIVGEKSAYDQVIDATTNLIANEQASSTINWSSCSTWTGFNLLDCTALVFGWQSASMSAQLNTTKNLVLHVAPLGYVTRMVDIFTASSSTSTDLVLAYTMPTGFNMLMPDMTWNFSQGVRDADSLLRTQFLSINAQPKSIWDIMMTPLTFIIWALYFFAVFHKLTGLRQEIKSTMGGKYLGKGVTEDEYRYKETLWRMSQRK